MPGPMANMAAAFRIPDLRKRILFVFSMFAVFVVGLHIPIPHVNRAAMEQLVSGASLLGLFDVFSGGAFRRFSVLAMSITPYINASIIFQLLAVVVPSIARLAKEGESGRKKISQYTRYLTVALAMLQAGGICVMLTKTNPPVLEANSLLALIPIIITLTAGTCFLMWMGEQITDKGIGNGVSLIIFCGILVRLPTDVENTAIGLRAGAYGVFNVLFLLVIWVATIAFITFIQQGQRKIPIQHARKVVGTRIYGGGTTTLPMRVNTAGVIPIIFAISIALLPAQVLKFIGPAITAKSADWGTRLEHLASILSPGGNPLATIGYFLLVVFFTYFYTAVTFNVADVADSLKKSGAFIPGIRPGKPTEQFLDRVLTRITLAGAIFLGIVAVLQYHVQAITHVTSFSLVGGTSLLIMVGVALETMQQIEAHLLMRQYEGFIK
jgi:preprotein translocase subunit SecY